MCDANLTMAVANDRLDGPKGYVSILPRGRLKQCDNCKKRLPEVSFPFHVHRNTLRSKCTCSDRCTNARAGQKAAYRKTENGKAAMRRADKGERRKSLCRERPASARGKAIKKKENAAQYATPMAKVMGRIRTRARTMRVRETSSKTIATWCGENGQERLAALIKSNPSFEIDHKIAVFWFLWKLDGNKFVRIAEVDEDALRRCWCIDNLQMIPKAENIAKSCQLLPDKELLPLRHCWPAWWRDQLPSEEVRAMRKGAKECDLGGWSEPDLASDSE